YSTVPTVPSENLPFRLTCCPRGCGMSDLAKKLGRRIYGFRKQGGLTQAALAEKCKISNEFMSAVERGAKLPSLDVLARIAVGLSVEIKDLFDFDRTPFRRLEPLPRN